MPPLDSQALYKAISHPVRVRILSALERGAASPSDLAREIDAPLSLVSYHVRHLQDLGLVELVEQSLRRGSVEHFYALTAPPQPRLTGAISHLEAGEALLAAAAAAAAGGFDGEHAVLSMLSVTVDHEGRAAIARELKQLEAEIDQAVAASGKRLAQRGGDDAARTLTLVTLLV